VENRAKTGAKGGEKAYKYYTNNTTNIKYYKKYIGM